MKARRDVENRRMPGATVSYSKPWQSTHNKHGLAYQTVAPVHRGPRNRAFTLMELVLVLGIVATLSLSLYAAMNAGFKARESALRQMSGVNSATVAMDLIEQDLQSVLAPSSSTTTALAGPFVGLAMGSPGLEADSLDLYTIGRDSGATNSPLSEGFRRVQLLSKTDGRSNLLVRRVTRNVLAQTVPEPEEEVLAKDVVALSFTYYDGLSWYEEWDSTLQENAMPLAVRVTLSLANPTKQNPGQTYTITRLIPLPCGGATATTGGAS